MYPLSHVKPDLRLCDLRVIDSDTSLLGQEVVGDADGRRLSGCSAISERLDLVNSHRLTVTSVLLEGPTKNRNLLSSDGVEEGVNNFSGESALLVFIL